MPDFGFFPPIGDPPLPPLPVPPARQPADINTMRKHIALVDEKLTLCSKDSRTIFTARDVQDLLLDVRNVLESLTSPSALVALAVELNVEAKSLKDSLDEA